jgi:hypothetical protein
MTAEFTKLQRLILATLEEAGEERLSALTNTVVSGHGRRAEVDAMSNALEGLQRAGLIDVARSKNATTLELIPMDESDALLVLQNLGAYLAWSDSKNIWTLTKDNSDIEILLTESGANAARNILSEDGFPNSKITI